MQRTSPESISKCSLLIRHSEPFSERSPSGSLQRMKGEHLQGLM
ncbi:hypothetical protein A2U01_0119416, partial [Trifolium medium]|nr:hypothetical protein [Trifolium medium]